MEHQTKGRFLALEGIDGSGKSTQIRYLTERLQALGLPVYTTMEPTDGPIGSLVHQIMTGRVKTDNRAIASLFAADRMDHLTNEVNGIKAKIDAGITVISDRYYFSSYAYHSVDLPMDWVIASNAPCKEILQPDATIFIDVDPEVSMQRIEAGRQHKELFEKKSRLIATRENYLKAFEKQPDETVILVDGNLSPRELSDAIWEQVAHFFI